MTVLLIIGAVFGYLFVAGGITYLAGGMEETEDAGAAWLFGLTWPASIPLGIAAGVIALVFASPFLLGSAVKERRKVKAERVADRAAEVARELAKVRADNARMERELGIGGAS